MLFIVLLIYNFVPLTSSQWPSITAFKMRFPGSCRRGQFDCGFARCIPLEKLHDGRADCFDLSDEYCFPGHIKCGSYCVDPRYSSQCFINPKEKLCNVKGTMPCKGFGECVLTKWLLDDKADCLDGSDEDKEYVAAFDFLHSVDPVTFMPIVHVTSLPPKDSFATESVPQQPLFFTITSRTLHPFTEVLKPLGTIHDQQIPLISDPPVEEKSHEKSDYGRNTPANPFDSIQLTSASLTATTIATNTAPFWTVLNVHNPISTSASDYRQKSQVLSPSIQPYGAFSSQVSPSSRISGEAINTAARTLWPKYILPFEKTAPQQQQYTEPARKAHISQTSSSVPQPLTFVPLPYGSVTISPLSSSGTWTSEHSAQPLQEPSPPSTETPRPLVVQWHPITVSTQQFVSSMRSPETLDAGSGIVPVAPFVSKTIAGIGVQQPPFATTTLHPYPLKPLNMPAATIVPVTEAITPPTITSFTLKSIEAFTKHIPDENIAMPTAATESIVGVWEAQPSSQSIMPSSAVGTAALTDQMHSSTSGMEWDALMAHRRECADSMIHNAKLMYPNPLCTCPVGQMPASLGRCQEAEISTFGVYAEEICESVKTNVSDRPSLVMQKLSETFPYAMCIRKDGERLVVNVLCDNDCTIDELISKYRESGDPQAPLKLEIDNLVCSDSDLNDCDDKADCIPHGLRYKCICGPGTNDTSNGRGRHCEGILIASTCLQLFGICILFWILLLLLLLLLPLLCCLGWFVYRRLKANREREEQTNLVSAEVERQSNNANSAGIAEPISILKPSNAGEKLNEQLQTLPNGGDNTLLKQSSSIKKLGLVRSKSIETDEGVTVLEPVLPGTALDKNSSTETSLSHKSVTIIAPVEKQQLPEMASSTLKNKVDSVEDKPVDGASRKSSTPSGNSSPTLWDAFKILGTEYIKRHSLKSRISSSASLDELIRSYEQKRTPVVSPRFEQPSPHHIPPSTVSPDHVRTVAANVGSHDISEINTDITQVVNNELLFCSGTTEKELTPVEENIEEVNLVTGTPEVLTQSEEGVQKSHPPDEEETTIPSETLMEEAKVKVAEVQPHEDRHPLGSRPNTEDSVQRKMNEMLEMVAETVNMLASKETSASESLPSVSSETVEVLPTGIIKVTKTVEAGTDDMNKTLNSYANHMTLPVHEPNTVENEVANKDGDSAVTTDADANALAALNDLHATDTERFAGNETDMSSAEAPGTARLAANCIEEMLDKLEESERKAEGMKMFLRKLDERNKSYDDICGTAVPIYGRLIRSEHGRRGSRAKEGRQPLTAKQIRKSAHDVALINQDVNLTGDRILKKPPTKGQKIRLSASCESLRYDADIPQPSDVAESSAQVYDKRVLEMTDGLETVTTNFDIDTDVRYLGVKKLDVGYRRFGAPQRKLSSISEKSVELASEEVEEAPSSKSCPNTTRINDDFKMIPELRRKFRRKLRRRVADKNEFLKDAVIFGSELDAVHFRKMPDICSKFKAKVCKNSEEAHSPTLAGTEKETLDIDLGPIETEEEQLQKSPSQKSGRGAAGGYLLESGRMSGAMAQRSDGENTKQIRSSTSVEREAIKNSDGPEPMQTSGESSAEYRNCVQAYTSSREGNVMNGDNKEAYDEKPWRDSSGKNTAVSLPQSSLVRGRTAKRDPFRDAASRSGSWQRRYGNGDLDIGMWNTAPNTSDSESGAPSEDATTKRFTKQRRSLDIRSRPPLVELHKHKPSTAIERKIASRRRASMATHLARLDKEASGSALHSTSSSVSESEKSHHGKAPWDSSPLREGELDIIAPIKSYIFPAEQDSTFLKTKSPHHAHQRLLHRSAATSPSPSSPVDLHLSRDRSISLANFRAKVKRDDDIWRVSISDGLKNHEPLVKENLWWGHG